MSTDSDHNDSSDGEDAFAMPHLFKSALDVGSHFIDIIPDNELVFINHQGTLFSQLTIKNVTHRAHVAYFVRIPISLIHSYRSSHQHHTQL